MNDDFWHAKLAFFSVMLIASATGCARAHDHEHPELNGWYESLHSGKGAKIVVSSNTQEDTDQAADALSKEGFDVAGVRCDITDRRDIGQFGAEAKRAFGKVDILFCVAVGSVSVGPVHEAELDALDNLLISTVSNNLALARQFLLEMAERRYGSIVMMSSIASQRVSPLLGGYGAAKAALNGIVRSIAVEWGASNVRANAIAPSMVRTAFSKDFGVTQSGRKFEWPELRQVASPSPRKLSARRSYLLLPRAHTSRARSCLSTELARSPEDPFTAPDL
jgi:NAD(P)-dependent dehydrogenase (short-subunit alcohol dehydrogenase family)